MTWRVARLLLAASETPWKLMSNGSLAAKKGPEQGLPYPNGWEWLHGLGRKGEEGFIPNLGSLDTDRKKDQGSHQCGERETHWCRERVLCDTTLEERRRNICLQVKDQSKDAAKIQLCEPVIFTGVTYRHRCDLKDSSLTEACPTWVAAHENWKSGVHCMLLAGSSLRCSEPHPDG